MGVLRKEERRKEEGKEKNREKKEKWQSEDNTWRLFYRDTPIQKLEVKTGKQG